MKVLFFEQTIYLTYLAKECKVGCARLCAAEPLIGAERRGKRGGESGGACARLSLARHAKRACVRLGACALRSAEPVRRPERQSGGGCWAPGGMHAGRRSLQWRTTGLDGCSQVSRKVPPAPAKKTRVD